MIFEIYLYKLIFFCLIMFIVGYCLIYLTITDSKHKNGFDTFYIFNKIKLSNLFEFIWMQIVLLIKFITLGNIELEKFDTKK